MKELGLDQIRVTPAVARAFAGIEEVWLWGVKVDDWAGLEEELATVRQERGGDIGLKKLGLSDETGLINFLAEEYGWTKVVPEGKLKRIL